jgi:molybdopterin/thiamine biosynthesis adenylyltransferase
MVEEPGILSLSPEEMERYSRQIGPGVFDAAAQARLKGKAALVARVGGMGGPAALALVAAGVGRVVIAHGGELTSPDLNRQILGSEEILGRPRAPHFADALRSMNRFVEVTAIDREPDDEEAMRLARQVDVVVSCPPTFQERLRLNRAAVAAGVPLIDAAQWGMLGTLSVLDASTGPCLECVYPEVPPFEEFFPVLGAISQATGSLAALEAIKILAGVGRSMSGRMLILDGFGATTRQATLKKNPDCRCCGVGRP